MKICILTGQSGQGWPTKQLINEIISQGHKPAILNFNHICAFINNREDVFQLDESKLEFDGGIIRSLGKSTTEQVTFRISLLEHMNLQGKVLINKPYSFRRAKDKYSTLVHLRLNKIPVPETYITENEKIAYNAAIKLKDVVIKPLIGSRGLGPIRSNDPDLSFRIIKTLSRLGLVLYIQEYIKKPNRDIRVFTVGDRVIGGIYRKSKKGKWKTNIASGGVPKKLELNDEIENLALKTAEVLELDYTGVDIVESPEGYKIIEANAAPSWRALQKVLKINVAACILQH
ncbi:MAG: RimK family alpha-L-glutamate ligase, partial [Candidatus Odinarchaeia archaeon]